jgi:hypothetical protein
MTREQADRLVMRETWIRHCDGPRGLYVGSWLSGSGLVLVVEEEGLKREWFADDCEVAS